MSRRVVLPGGSGFLGRALARRLVAGGDEVVVLTRGAAGARDGVRFVRWDAASTGPWVAELDGAAAVVHLTGKRVDCRPTRANVAELVRSRVEPVRLVGEALRTVTSPPPVWVQSATLAIYGDGGEQVITETTPVPGTGPPQMVQVALAWERAFTEATAGLERTVLLRTGIVIGGEDDPATRRLALLARLGLGGPVAGGRQWLSWVGLEDAVAAFERAVGQAGMRGLYHLVAPNPVRNREAMAAFRRALGRRAGLPSPAWLTRLGAPVLGSDPELALTGRRAYPERLLAEGFTFRRTDFDPAVRDAVAGLGAPQAPARD